MWLMLQKESRKCRNYSFKMEWSHKNFQHYGRVKESRMATVHFLLQTHRNAEGRVWKKRKKSPASRRRISKWKWQWTWYFRPLSLGSGTYIAIGKWAERWTSKYLRGSNSWLCTKLHMGIGRPYSQPRKAAVKFG